MKTIYEHDLGGDGAKAGAYLDGGSIEVKLSYPVAKLATPITDLIDQAIDKVEALIPGDWDKAILDPVRASMKAEIIKLLSE